ncbi:MAG: hypothetical protein V4547_16955 [Bacteroidota bacterium]
MILTNLDIICRRWLLEKNIPIHYYFEALTHSSTALRELSFDTLQIINSCMLPVGDYGEVNLPDDFVDDLLVCAPVSGALAPLPKQDWITPLRIHSTTTGEFVPYPGQENNTGNPNLFYGLPNQWSYYWNVNEYGESVGRRFGGHGGTAQGYQLFKQRRQIQMTQGFIGGAVTLLYISDGQSVDNATQIDTLAISCIQAYIDWKSSPNRSLKDSAEARTFYNEQRKLRARLNPLTPVDIRNLLRESYTAGIKN